MILHDLQDKILRPRTVYKAVYFTGSVSPVSFPMLHSPCPRREFPNHTLLYDSVILNMLFLCLQGPPLHPFSAWKSFTHFLQFIQLKDHLLLEAFPLSLKLRKVSDPFLWTFLWICLWPNPSHTTSNYVFTQLIPQTNCKELRARGMPFVSRYDRSHNASNKEMKKDSSLFV